LPGKNIKPINGKPLIAYAVEAAKGSAYVDRVVVSTDDEAIAAVAKEFGAELPFMRPEELASDTATSLAVLQHAVSAVEADGQHYDLVVLVQPTVPGVLSTDVDAAIEKLVATGANSSVSVTEITERPEWMYRLDTLGRASTYVEHSDARSQDLEHLYRGNGAVFVMRHSTLMEKGMILDHDNNAAVIMPRERSLDIDTPHDFFMAEQTLMRLQEKGNH
jgi:CMP-N-acetylneuraminic acid synthetase